MNMNVLASSVPDEIALRGAAVAPQPGADAPQLQAAFAALLDHAGVANAEAEALVRAQESSDEQKDHNAAPEVLLLAVPSLPAWAPVIERATMAGRNAWAGQMQTIPQPPSAGLAFATPPMLPARAPAGLAPVAGGEQDLAVQPQRSSAGLSAVLPEANPAPTGDGVRGRVQQDSVADILRRLESPQPALLAAAPAAEGQTPGVPGVRLPAAAVLQSRPQLLEALGDRIRMQIDSRSETAVIRLDPPAMGRIEITVRHEAGALQIQLAASNGEVLRQLQAVTEMLRQDLVQRQYGDVAVQVFDSGQDSRGRQRQAQDEAEPEVPGRALAESDEEAGTFRLATDKHAHS